MLRESQPHRVVEIGSGNSSKVIARALRMNAQGGGVAATYEVVDPNADEVQLRRLPWPCRAVRERVELTDLRSLTTLRDGDVLFIDSGHTVRIGGDVNFLFLEVILRLGPGVVVHVHDINLPYEYDRSYALGAPGAFRMLWTEAYLLQAFLTNNAEWDVLLGMRLLMIDHLAAFRQAFPQFDPEVHSGVSSSFWMRRRRLAS